MTACNVLYPGRTIFSCRKSAISSVSTKAGVTSRMTSWAARATSRGKNSRDQKW